MKTATWLKFIPTITRLIGFSFSLKHDKSQLKIVEILAALDYELNEYSVASRKFFDNYYEAVDYAKNLAKENGLNFVSDDRQDYLD